MAVITQAHMQDKDVKFKTRREPGNLELCDGSTKTPFKYMHTYIRDKELIHRNDLLNKYLLMWLMGNSSKW